MASSVAVLGIGSMGLAFVNRLLHNNIPVVAWNRTRSKVEHLTSQKNVTLITDVKDAIKLVKALWDDAAVHSLLEGLSKADLEGKTLVCTMTISPDKSKEFESIVTGYGGEWVETPVLGNSLVAETGKLQVCVGGTKEQYDRLVPLLSCFGTPRYVGAVGKATTMKLGVS